MQLIDGQAIARTIRAEVARDVAALVAAGHRPPGLAAVLVGEDPASKVYVGSKGRACRAAGLHSVTLTLPASTSQAELMEHVRALNQDPAIDGILVQLPLPAGLDEQAIIESIDPAKDVDSFHPANVGRVQIGLEDAFAPATPAGVLELLRRSELPTAGRHLVVLGRSNIVGKPLMALMVQKGVDCTVTVCHSRTRDLAEHCRRADILVAAIGRPGAITAGMVKPGAVVIDVGINRVDDASAPKGYRIVGDVDFESVAPLCSAITPVPGGVGPMTIAMLLSNTLRSARRRLGITAK